MEYLINLVGNYSIGWGITIIAALVFLVLCYRKVENYFSDKAIHEKEKNEQFKKVMDQVNMYPSWHQQSLEIQQQFNKSIAELKEGMDQHQKQLEKIEEDIISRETDFCSRIDILQVRKKIRFMHGAKWRQMRFGLCLRNTKMQKGMDICIRLYSPR